MLTMTGIKLRKQPYYRSALTTTPMPARKFSSRRFFRNRLSDHGVGVGRADLYIPEPATPRSRDQLPATSCVSTLKNLTIETQCHENPFGLSFGRNGIAGGDGARHLVTGCVRRRWPPLITVECLKPLWGLLWVECFKKASNYG